MSEKNYKLVFEGKIIDGHDIGKVKKNLISLLKTNEKGIRKLFSGEAVVIKKDMDQQTAMKYSQTLNKAGALCRLEQEGQAADQAETEIKQKETEKSDKPEMIHCPDCNYKQKKSQKCIMCGAAINRNIPAHEESADIPKTNVIRKKILSDEILLTNIESVPGYEIVEHFGLVSGSTIRAKHIGRDIMASLKNLVGGELKGYTQLLQESREEAVERMKEQARSLGANAIINIRFSTSSVAQGAAELYAYGTAVRVE